MNHKTKSRFLQLQTLKKLFKPGNFEKEMKVPEEKPSVALKDVRTKYVGFKKDLNLKFIVMNTLQEYENVGCAMSLKVHFIFGLFS